MRSFFACMALGLLMVLSGCASVSAMETNAASAVSNCDMVPDLAFSIDCASHDDCYYDANRTRRSCDLQFRDDMQTSCARQPIIVRQVCDVVADVYYQGVRWFGSSHYKADKHHPGGRY